MGGISQVCGWFSREALDEVRSTEARHTYGMFALALYVHFPNPCLRVLDVHDQSVPNIQQFLQTLALRESVS